MGDIEHKADDWQPRPGEMHEIDQAFYNLAIKERDFERMRVGRLEAQLAGAVDAERARIAGFVRSRSLDSWDPGVEAALQQVAHEIARGHHVGGRYADAPRERQRP